MQAVQHEIYEIFTRPGASWQSPARHGRTLSKRSRNGIRLTNAARLVDKGGRGDAGLLRLPRGTLAAQSALTHSARPDGGLQIGLPNRTLQSQCKPSRPSEV